MTLFALILAIGIVANDTIIGKRLLPCAPRPLLSCRAYEIRLHNFVQ